MIALSEAVIVRHILEYLSFIGAKAGKTKTMGVKRGNAYCFDKFTYRGFPDITGFHKGQIFFIEAKAGRNKQSNDQLLFQQMCKEAGILYILAYDLAQVQAIITAKGIEPLPVKE